MATSLLDRYAALQKRPLGTSTALSKATSDEGNPYGQLSSAGKQYRSLEGAYGRALRILNHAARRGDAKSALQAIDVRKQAMGEGFAPGGIRNSAESDANINGMIDYRNRRSTLAEQEAGVRMGRGQEELADLPPEPVARENVGYNPGGAGSPSPDILGAERSVYTEDPYAGDVDPYTGQPYAKKPGAVTPVTSVGKSNGLVKKYVRKFGSWLDGLTK